MNITKFNQFLQHLGYILPNGFNYSIGTNEIVRFKDENKKSNNKNLWLHRVDLNTYVFGDWSANEKHVYRDDAEYTPRDYKAFKYERERAEQEQQARYVELANECEKEYNHQVSVDTAHPLIAHSYLVKKNIKAYNIKSNGNALVIPIYGTEYPFIGQIQSLQYILPNGFKQFKKGAKYKGGCFNLNEASTSRFIFAEGYATCCSILSYIEAKNYDATVICAFTCGNLEAVITHFRKIYPNAYFEIWADKDPSGIGQETAKKIAINIAAVVRIPPLSDEQVNNGLTDFNDFFNLKG